MKDSSRLVEDVTLWTFIYVYYRYVPTCTAKQKNISLKKGCY